MSITYQQAGVNIAAGDEAVNRIKNKVKKTFSKHVLTSLGGYGGVFDIKEATKNYSHPVLVQSIDGVGTKIMIAKMTGDYSNIGRDLVSNVVGDILVMGAKPLTFLDYIANETLRPEIVETIVSGMADACAESDISLIGGETAEMPGIYKKDEVDLAGIVTGVVEKDKIITGKDIKIGDIVLGLPSSGIHTNGFSLARKIIFEIGKYGVSSKIPELDKDIGQTLLEPHINYTKDILNLIDLNVKISGLAHITGGGFIENIPRILPDNHSVEIKKNTWFVHPIFDVLQQVGEVEELEMYRTFNMGIGMIVIASPPEADNLKKIMNNKIYEIGTVVKGNKKVSLI